MKKNQNLNTNWIAGIGQELKKVDWPSRSEALQLTGIVVIISILLGIYIGAFDYLFAFLLQLVLKTR